MTRPDQRQSIAAGVVAARRKPLAAASKTSPATAAAHAHDPLGRLQPTSVLGRALACPAAARELWLESKGQIDFYDDERLIELAAGAIGEFFADVIDDTAAND